MQNKDVKKPDCLTVLTFRHYVTALLRKMKITEVNFSRSAVPKTISQNTHRLQKIFRKIQISIPLFQIPNLNMSVKVVNI